METSYFGLEFVSLRIATDLVEFLIYTPRCFGLRLDGPDSIFCDNKSVVTKSSVPTSRLNRCHNEIYYHQVRESQAVVKIHAGWFPGESNPADLLTKTTMAGNYRHLIVEIIFQNKAVKCKGDNNNDGRVG